LALREFNLVAPSPIWLIPVILVVGQLIATAAGIWRARSPSRLRLHVWIASRAILVTATIYATGWGPALAFGLILIGQETLVLTGPSSERAVLGWSLACLAAGEVTIALGWAPSLVPVPEVHGLAILMAIGIVFSNRSLRSALIEREEAAALTESREHRFRALVQSSSELVFVLGSARTVTYASPSCSKVLGYEPDVLVGSEPRTLVHEDDIEELRSCIGRIIGTKGGSAEFSARALHYNGTWRWLEGLATNLRDDPDVEGIVINARDVTERKARSERQSAISDLGREVLRSTTLEESVRLATGVIDRVLHVEDSRIIGTSDSRDSNEQHVTSVALHDDEAGIARPDRGAGLRVPVGDPEKPLAYIEVFQEGALEPYDQQFLEAISGVVLSATVRFGAEDAIRHQALHDPLTGLPNRGLFSDRLRHALNRRARVSHYLAVMIVDLDGFKNVNDSLGHLAGDELLIAVADRLRDRLRGFDTIARLGGDEFALLFDELDAPDQAGGIAQRVLDALAIPLSLPEREVAIGASVGIAVTNHAGANVDRLLADADAAMYRAKREGKGCYRVFEAAMHTAAVERMNLEQELRAAIRDCALTIFYQPIVDTNTGRVTSFEALARWNNPTRGFVPPDTFIPLAEDSGIIIELGRTVLLEACRQTQELHARFPELRPSISVNASRLQLANAGFFEHVTDALASADLDPSSLIVEVTESILANESENVTATLDELRRIGVRIAIDDFGTGHSSFAALAELPIDILKIDKRFIDRLMHDEEGLGLVSAILQLAHTLHLDTTAEGVELLEQRDALSGLGCSHIQGYLYSPPMPGDATLDFLERNAASTNGAQSSQVTAGLSHD
jgi:diguanylate cyclase (GGDEF)-like protein/PAS domain S-box-containing protein